MKTVAVIASCDTKLKEVRYMQEILFAQGVKPLVVDMSIGPNETEGADISREEVHALIDEIYEDYGKGMDY